MNIPYNERLLRFTTAEEEILEAKLKGVRTAIDHPAEKGKAVETQIRQLIRDLLPTEYGVTTGFIAFHDNSCQSEVTEIQDANRTVYSYDYLPDRDTIGISTQIDVIIYDALRFSPIAKLGTCDVLPAEAVYAYVEVKSFVKLRAGTDEKEGLASILAQSRRLRDIQIRQYHIPIPGSYTQTALLIYPKREAIQIRSFVFILDTAGSVANGDSVCALLKDTNSQIMGHLSGAYIHGIGYFASHHTDRIDDPEVGTFHLIDATHPLSAFRNAIYISLSRFPRPKENWVPAVDRYFDLSDEFVPAVTSEYLTSQVRPSIKIDMDRMTLKRHEAQ
jgi:hypothetical protein